MFKILLRGGQVYLKNTFVPQDIKICGDEIVSLSPFFSQDSSDCDLIYDFSEYYILPGFADVHVHLREPGLSYKETIKSGSMAAARGGFTTVCTMPNLKPPPDTPENIETQLEIIRNDAVIEVKPYGTLTLGRIGKEAADFESMKKYTRFFSDDGSGIQSHNLIKSIMTQAAKAGVMVVSHCEDESLINGGYIHKGVYAYENHHVGICSESEWVQVKRDIELAGETGCALHICHVSTKESVEIIRKAKNQGINVTCETAPHYIAFCDTDLKDDGAFKMNPPIRAQADKQALIQGIIDGTVDMIATDHAPHNKKEKSKGLRDSLMGVVGLETAFAAVYTHLVKSGIITMKKLVEIMSINPRKRFDLYNCEINTGSKANLTIVDINTQKKVCSKDFLSMGKSTPFNDMELYGEVIMTYTNGGTVWKI